PLVTADFDLPALLHSAVGLFTAAADSKGIEIHLSIGQDVPRWCRGDAGRLRQVLVNLLSNAVKFTAVGNVRLSVEAVQSRRSVGEGPFELRFLVADSGPGVAAADRDKLFRPFFQLDSHEARAGSGLGLAIVKGLVDRFGGSLGLADRPGGGSIFWVRLPLLPGSPVATDAPSEAVPAERSGASFDILVAEDSPVNQLIATEQLRSAGHRVTVANNGREALEMAAHGGFDLILMDVIMPEMDGIDAARAIRRLEAPVGTVPIVALTANVMSEDRARILTSGMDGVLGKPFNRARLLDIVARFARRSANHEAAPAARPAPPPEPAPEPGGETPPLEFDPGPLRRMNADVGAEVAARLARMFSGELADRRSLMATALQSGNMPELRRIAHTIKGGAQTFGLMRLSEAALALERAVEGGAADRLGDLVAEVDREAGRGFDLIEAALRDAA
ncbi:response regulator, partial [Stella sp.]|uniref:response regulator n=1 Tax=Stella sp. TaxID=2912054 RepID=UPI0035AE3893